MTAALSLRNVMDTSPAGMDGSSGLFAMLDQQQGRQGMSAEDKMKETIHSGHFMMSNVPQDEEDENAEDPDPGEAGVLVEGNLPAVPENQQMEIVPSNNRQRCNSDPLRQDNGRLNIAQRKVIDSSLSKLFECMTLAYRAKLTSPKWNNFKGLKLRWTIKIRLNNVIWRAWHMQFVKQVRPLIAPFAIEVDLSAHNKQEGGPLLEGKYWKRKLSMVSSEYRRWRVWYRDRANGVNRQNAKVPAPGSMEADFLERYGVSYGVNASNWVPQPNEEPMLVEDFNFLPDFTDALLAHLTNNPFAFPNPREIAQAGNADFIQPGLLQLQPCLDDFMDTLEPLQEFFANSGFQMSSASGFGNQFQNYGFGSSGNGNNLGGGSGDSMNTSSGSTLPLTDAYPSSSGGYWRPSIAMNELANEAIQNRLTQQAQAGQYITTTTNQRHVVPFQKDVSMTSYSNQSSPGAYLPTPSNPPYDPYGGAVSGAAQTLRGTPTSNYSQQNSLYVPSPYPSVISSLNRTPQQVTANVSEEQANYDARKEMKQRSLSGPTNGQPLIDPAVLGNLANFNRSSSVSNGNLAYLQPKEEIMRAAAAANTVMPPKNTKKTGANVSFAVPQVATKPRRPVKSAKTVQEPVIQPHPMQQQQPLRMESAYGSAGGSSSSSTLAQLLIGGSPFGNSGNTVPVIQQGPSPQSAPAGAKKLAPKLAPKADLSPKSGPPNVNPFSMNMTVQSPPAQATSPSIINVDLTRQSDLSLSKMEFTGSQDSTRFRLKSEEPDPRNPRNVEHKRINHISAEQKRRGHIKSGFEVLHGLVPSLAQNSSVKVSKAIVLHKGAEYIRQLKEERRTMQAEAEVLRQQIEAINQAVIICQQQLPATGAPVSSRARNDRMNEMLDDYVRARTQQNWKFWLFSHIVRPLFDNFVSNVSTRSIDDMSRSTSSWVDQQCTLVQLRPLIKESMRKLSTTTHILSDPARLPDEARQAVQKNSSSGSTLQAHGSSTHRTNRDS